MSCGTFTLPPVGFCKQPGAVGDVPAEVPQLDRIVDVQNQRIVLGPALGQKDLLHRLRIQSVGSQTVNRFGGDAHQTARPDQLGGSFEILFRC